MRGMPDSDGDRVDRDGAAYERSFGMSKAQLGMAVFLASLSVLFAACLFAMILTRLGGAAWPEPGFRKLPRGLLVSTALMVGLSASLHRAVAAVRRNGQRTLAKSLNWAFGLGLAFVVVQVLNWMQVSLHHSGGTTTLYPFIFYFLTGLHVAHVAGGLVPLGVIRAKAREGDYSSSNHEVVRLCAQYWHFLGIVWLVLGVSLLFLE